MSRDVRRRWWWVLWGLLTVSALGITAVFVPPYLVGGTTVPGLNRAIPGYYVSLVIHAVPAGLALAIGPFQFVTRLRLRWPRAHRIAGRVYLISVVIAAAAAAYSSAVTESGFSLQVAFYLLIAAWLYTGAMAYRTIRRGEVRLHRIWMIRNYALTFAAVTLRLYQLAGLQLMEVWPALEYQQVYIASAWASLFGNAVIAEYFIIQRTLAPLARRRGRSEHAGQQREELVGQAGGAGDRR
ncbi:DUF2306 domain-containing protein [Catenuloplanes atrovinosus]|uniref:Membrane protein n=1 Tax=Catenuloplanes atrovinosus TaxID=137266 RepID=A0AAE3YQX6_9ACTN|nr:DUF2306 domain-containing protein [Catenuloplanes atrovinosus]MDR7278348.1 putative membrane protein [Catenuloplanes atrovinosus]